MFTLGEMSAILGHNPQSYLPTELAEATPAVVVTDSRKAEQGSLFVCIKGERADGHDFAAKVAEQGALAVLAEKDVFPGQTPPLAVLRCEDSVKSLGILGAAWRGSFNGQVTGLTGSAGKTSVKEALSAVLSVRGKTARNFLNLNSQIGLPMSMLNADLDALFWVFEAGINQKHDMDELGAILQPDLAIVLNVGDAHLSGLSDKGVAYYKSRLLTHIKPGGKALVSADYPDLLSESKALGVDLRLFSTKSRDADYYAEYTGAASAVSGRYLVSVKGTQFEVIAPFRGAYGAENVAAVSGAAHLLGLSNAEIAMGLSQAQLPAQRFNCEQRGGFTLIDDSYNANPLSALRMLDTAAEMAREAAGPLFLVLGEMLELGDDAVRAHKDYGLAMATSGAKVVLWKGGQTEAVMAGLAQGGFKGVFRQAQTEKDFSEALALFGEHAKANAAGKTPGVAIFKGSRGMRLEKYAALFRERYLNNLID